MKNTILEFKSKKKGLITPLSITSDKKYSKEGETNSYELVNCLNGIASVQDGDYYISKVRRESDGEAFEIGDCIVTTDGIVGKVVKFYYEELSSRVSINIDSVNNLRFYIDDLKKLETFIKEKDRAHKERRAIHGLMNLLGFLTGNNIIVRKSAPPTEAEKEFLTKQKIWNVKDTSVSGKEPKVWCQDFDGMFSYGYSFQEHATLNKAFQEFVPKKSFLYGTGVKMDSMNDFEYWFKEKGHKLNNPMFTEDIFPSKDFGGRKEVNINANHSPEATEKKEIKFVVGKTEDSGKEIFLGDTYFTVCTDAASAKTWVVNGPYKAVATFSNPNTKPFLSKEVAEEYIIQNKPLFSLKEFTQYESYSTSFVRVIAKNKINNEIN